MDLPQLLYRLSSTLINEYMFFQDTEVLLQQLEKDTEAVNQVREIVEHEEGIMKKETQIVQDYADVRLISHF